jgi:mannose-6-phosphate isomerase-like protein (cupin superfamily)
VSIGEGFSAFSDHWSPKIAGQINNFHIKLVKIEGDFVWHHHDVEDELFLVTKGEFTMKLRDPEERDILVQQGEFIVIPAGVEHCPCAAEECEIILLEPATTLNTGNIECDKTVKDLGSVVDGKISSPR